MANPNYRKEWRARKLAENPDFRHQESVTQVEWRRAKHREIIEKLGGKCWVCGWKERLELHHLTYVNGNPYKEGHNGFLKTIKKATEHPENFQVLCHVCHKTVSNLAKLNLEARQRLLSLGEV